jgi:hypothetical protein
MFMNHIMLMNYNNSIISTIEWVNAPQNASEAPLCCSGYQLNVTNKSHVAVMVASDWYKIRC